MNYRSLLIIFFALSSFLSKGQFSENFSDSNFTLNPTWIGNDTNFVIDTIKRLQLSAPAVSGNSYLSTASKAIENATWEFSMKLDFNPSSSNYSRVYLISSSSNLSGSLNGYYVMIGNSSDEVSLYRQSGTSRTKIIDGRDDVVDVSQVNLKVKVTRDSLGNWELFSDTSLTGYISEGTSMDVSYLSSKYFGIYCNYTSSRSDKFFFDDIQVIGTEIIDRKKPTIDTVSIVNIDSIRVVFSEFVKPSSALNPVNYFITNGIGNPFQVSYIDIDSTEVLLQLPNDLLNTINYQLNIKNITDNANNTMDSASINISFQVPFPGKSNEIIFNEIFPDPSPQIGLPDKEYVELYNIGGRKLFLWNWLFKDGTSSGSMFPKVWINPYEYVILCAEDDTTLFKPYGKTIGLKSWPSLNNSGDNLQLIDPFDKVIQALSYSIHWYDDTDKSNGGYSLELINPKDSCAGESTNWTASLDTSGGTPGRVNSVFNNQPDNVAPTLEKYEIINDSTILLLFDEEIDSSSIQLNNWKGELLIKKIVLNDLLSDSIWVQFQNGLENGVEYKLQFSNLKDCYGNSSVLDSIKFGLGVLPSKYELVFTEVFSNPNSDNTNLPNNEYLEIYNRSDKLIQLKNCKLSDKQSTTQLKEYLLKPNEYLILTTSSGHSNLSAFGSVLAVSSWPSLNNSEDDITLRDSTGNFIHSINYRDDWHDELKQIGGWSLESIDYNNVCEESENWGSSLNSNGGTPGKINSIYATNPDLIAPSVLQVIPQSSYYLQVDFEEKMDSLSVLNASYEITGNTVDTIIEIEETTVLVFFNKPFIKGEINTINIGLAKDCAGNVMNTESFDFGLPEQAEINDVVINELLFNPRQSGVDYIEVFNRSNKYFDLDGWELANFDNYYDTLSTVRGITYEGHLLAPNEYRVFTTDKSNVMDEYFSNNPKAFFQMTSIPSLPNDKGNILLIDNSGNTIDRFDYSEDMHHPSLESFEGVSLERIDFFGNTEDEKNWHSAAESAGFGTPGIENSQARKDENTSNKKISVQPEVFSPDLDGYQDICSINYSLDEVGLVGTVQIYSQRGALIRELTENEVLAKEGYLLWDGLDDDGKLVKYGPYIILFDVYDLEGYRKRYKELVVVAF